MSLKNLMSKKNICSLCNCLSAFALVIATNSANTTCVFVAHQPELPKSAKKLRKF